MKTFHLGLPGALAVFSTRQGGVSAAPYDTLNLGLMTGDDPKSVNENRLRLAARVGVAPERVAMGRQVHGAELQEWEEPMSSRFVEPDAGIRKVDGHVTEAPGIALLVLVADCLPVALSDGRRIAMLHCGWRGIAAGILERALERFDTVPAAGIGPGIGQCCYEVGEEVLSAFADLDGVADGRMLDLRAVAVRRLKRAGVKRVEHMDICTSCNPELFFSHRRDGPETGRQSGVVVLRDER
jgi:YfiH family protein